MSNPIEIASKDLAFVVADQQKNASWNTVSASPTRLRAVCSRMNAMFPDKTHSIYRVSLRRLRRRPDDVEDPKATRGCQLLYSLSLRRQERKGSYLCHSKDVLFARWARNRPTEPSLQSLLAAGDKDYVAVTFYSAKVMDPYTGD